MESTLIIIAFISMCGVLGNFFLQAYWFYWSYGVHKRKHFTDEQEDIKRVIDIFEEEFKKREEDWEAFIPKSEKQEVPVAAVDFIDFSTLPVSTFPKIKKRNKDSKYNPDEITGKLDNFFDLDKKDNDV